MIVVFWILSWQGIGGFHQTRIRNNTDVTICLAIHLAFRIPISLLAPTRLHSCHPTRWQLFHCSTCLNPIRISSRAYPPRTQINLRMLEIRKLFHTSAYPPRSRTHPIQINLRMLNVRRKLFHVAVTALDEAQRRLHGTRSFSSALIPHTYT